MNAKMERHASWDYIDVQRCAKTGVHATGVIQQSNAVQRSTRTHAESTEVKEQARHQSQPKLPQMLEQTTWLQQRGQLSRSCRKAGVWAANHPHPWRSGQRHGVLNWRKILSKLPNAALHSSCLVGKVWSHCRSIRWKPCVMHHSPEQHPSKLSESTPSSMSKTTLSSGKCYLAWAWNRTRCEVPAASLKLPN